MMFFIIVSVTVLVISFLGLFVYFRNRNGESNIQFAFLTGFIALWIITLFLYYTISDYSPLQFIGRLNFTVTLPITYFLYRFVYVFPKKTIYIPKLVNHLFLASVIIVAVLSLLTSLIVQEEIAQGTDRLTTYGDLYILWPLVFGVNLLSGIILVFIKIYKSKGLERTQLLYLLLGFISMFGVGITTNVILPYFKNYDLQQLGPLGTIFFVGLTTHAIVKHRLLNIRFLVVRSIGYAILLSIIISGYTFSIFWISNTFFTIKTDFTQSLIFSSLTIFVALTFPFLKDFIKKITNRFFFKNDYNAKLLLFELTNIMAKTLELDRLVNNALTELINGMHLSNGSIFIFKDNKIYYKQLFKISNQNLYVEETLTALAAPGKILLLQEEEDPKLIEIMEKLNISVCLPLINNEVVHGLVLLGEKNNGEIFTEADIEFLELFQPTFAIAVENSRSYVEIKGFNKKLQEEIHKETRELRDVNSKLLDANKHLLELDKLKDNFVAITSHELRTPLTVIRGNMWLILKESTLEEKTRKRIEVAKKSSEDLINFVNDILDISSIEMNKIKMMLSKVNLIELIKDIEEELSGVALKNKIVFKNDFDEKEYYVLADPARLRQIIINLLNNAIKFSKQSGTITVSCLEKDKKILIEVKDTGIGIRKEDMSKLFSKFGKIDTDLNRNLKGVGLGLYITKKLVEMMNGKISADSEFGKGTTFTFTIPVFESTSTG